MDALARSLVVLGAVLMLAGAAVWLSGRVPWLGRLPGDIHIRGKNFSVHFPLATCLVLSALASLILTLLKRR